jgi:hypothetical protein
MRHLAQFLQSKWEEILVTGIWVPLVLAAASTADPVMIALSLVGGAASLFGLYSLVDKLSQRRQLPKFGGEASKIPRRGNLFSVGLQTDTIDYAIKGQKPEYLAFLCTEESLPVLDKLIAQHALREGQWRREIVDARDITDIRAKTNLLIDWLLRQGLTSGDIVVDPTGGLTPMSLGVFSVAQERQIDSQYMRSRYQSNRPIPGTQELVLLSHYPR